MFIEIPASKKSIEVRRLVFGVGINDADYIVRTLINDDRYVICPFYTKWYSMLSRCYSKKVHLERPTYTDCTVCESWLTFSNFKRWMINQNWQGMALDKDYIEPMNKIYSPSRCAFITRSLNSLLNDNASIRGKWPKGVNYHKRIGMYQSRVSYQDKRVHLGYYSTPKGASIAYVKAKVKIILEAANDQADPRIANGLRQHAKLLANEEL